MKLPQFFVHQRELTSKAFTRESDQDEDDDLQLPKLQISGKNYMTPAGYALMRHELLDLIDVERPKIVDVVHIEIAEVIDPSVHHGNDQIFFGATVTYVEEGGVERTITIRGVDEAVSARGEVSWVSPIARTLLKARQGDVLKLCTPTGAVEIEVALVSYPAKVSC